MASPFQILDRFTFCSLLSTIGDNDCMSVSLDRFMQSALSNNLLIHRKYPHRTMQAAAVCLPKPNFSIF